MKSSLLLVALILSVQCAFAAPKPLVTIDDPAGDDYGAGSLIYPQRADFQAGDLDILKLQISRDTAGFWFEATFKNPIRDPEGVLNAMNGPEEPLSSFARKGFYQFNIDIYVDTDRVSGSGNTFTLPGRQVTIDHDYAWEKAVILTPRPELMREQLLDALAEQFPRRAAADNEAQVDRSIFFPTRIKVHGRSIAFFVPAAFFGGSDGSDWAVTAFVTGAMTAIPADFTLLPTSKTALERLPLGVMQPALGHPRETFGYGSGLPAPVVDLLCESASQQSSLLRAHDDLRGMAWGTHAAAPVVAGATPVTTFASLFAEPAADVAVPASAPVSSPSPESIANRLQTLQDLLDRKLITGEEYRQQKQRILNEL